METWGEAREGEALKACGEAKEVKHYMPEEKQKELEHWDLRINKRRWSIGDFMRSKRSSRWSREWEEIDVGHYGGEGEVGAAQAQWGAEGRGGGAANKGKGEDERKFLLFKFFMKLKNLTIANCLFVQLFYDLMRFFRFHIYFIWALTFKFTMLLYKGFINCWANKDDTTDLSAAKAHAAGDNENVNKQTNYLTEVEDLKNLTVNK